MSSLLVENVEAKVSTQNGDDSMALTKEQKLRELFRQMGSALVAFSGQLNRI